MIVLLPTPDDPSSAAVRPPRQVRRDLLEPLLELRTEHVDRAHRRAAATTPRRGRRSSPESGLVSSTTGVAPLSRAISRYRSSRRTLKSSSSAMTMKMTSTLAATTCSSVTLPAMRREKRLRRGSTATIAPRSSGPLAHGDPVTDCRQFALPFRADVSSDPRARHRFRRPRFRRDR